MQLSLIGEDFFFSPRLNIYVKGYSIFQSKILIKDELASHLYQIMVAGDFQKLNGQFAAVLEIENEIWILSDLIRSIPLFYVKKEHQVFIADRAMKLKKYIHHFKLNNSQILSFATTGFCFNDETLISPVKQTQAAQFIRLSEKGIYQQQYFRFPADKKWTNFVEAKNEFKELIFNTFKDYLPFFALKKIVLPLSSGLDSRLLAVLLKEFGFRDVLCYTFGRKNSHEIPKSKKVAEVLGFEWVFIDYELLENTYFDDELLRYLEFAGNASSMPFAVLSHENCSIIVFLAFEPNMFLNSTSDINP